MEFVLVYGLWIHPLVVPAAAAWCLAALVAWRRVRAGRARTGAPPPTAWSLLAVCALGVLLAVTVTPSRIGLGLDLDTHEPVWCHPQWPRTGFGLVAPSGERRWNVLMAVPLGLAATAWFWARGAFPRRGASRSRDGGPAASGGLSTWCARLAPVVALAAPVAVELVQASLPPLGRVCAVVDAVDNISGVLLGAVVATLGAAVVIGVRHAVTRAGAGPAGRRRPPPRARGPRS